MSVETLDIYRDQRLEQIENGPFSQEFTISGAGSGTFRGIFDTAQIAENKDAGNVEQKKPTPRILVSTVPAGLVERASVITTEESVAYTFYFNDVDQEGIPVLWLY